MNKLSYNQFFKKNNLLPDPSSERWKYFDFKSFASQCDKIEYSQFKPEVRYTDNLDSAFDGAIKISAKEILVSKSLKDLIEIEILNNYKTKNTSSKLDFVMTDLNFRDFTCQLKLKSKKHLKVSLTYLNSENQKSLNPNIIFEVIDSELTIFEFDETVDETLLSLHTKINLINSKLNLISIYGSSISSDSKIINSEISLQSDSFYNHTLFLIKNKFIRYQQTVALKSDKSEANLSAFNISDESSFSELRTEVLHLEPKGLSRQLFKTIVSDSSRSVFNGRVFVDSKAQKTDSAQLCQGLILNPKAEINAKPELEIYADDVKASHGAAIGQLGKDQVFYLVSRGISPETAYQMLAHAFAGEVLSKVESIELRKKCEKIIEKSSGAIFEKLAESFGS